jgi:hypothetical protein
LWAFVSSLDCTSLLTSLLLLGSLSSGGTGSLGLGALFQKLATKRKMRQEDIHSLAMMAVQ